MKKSRVLTFLFFIIMVHTLSALDSILVLPCSTEPENAALAETITDFVISTVSSNGFTTSSQEVRQKALEELEFGLTGLVDEKTLLKIGKMTLASSVLQSKLLVNAGMWYLTVSVSTVETGMVKNSVTEVYRSSATLLEACSGQVLRCLGLKAEVDTEAVVLVTNMTELLQAIGPDKIIKVQPGNYDLSPGYTVKNKYITWVNEYDGPCPIVKSVQNLTIIGTDMPVLMIKPAYGWVLSFENCTGLTLSGLVLGHTVPGECMGGVLRLKNCSDVEVRNCELYGSGTYGFEIERSNNVVFENSLIRNCTFGLGIFRNSSEISFIETEFRETGEYYLFELGASDHILWDSCEFLYNQGSLFFYLDDISRDLQIIDCNFKGNEVDEFTNRPDTLEIVAGTSL